MATALELELRQYYQNCFPLQGFFEWLSYGGGTNFRKREFSFTLHDDIYLRFRSYETAAELGNDLQKLCPVKMDLGAIYNVAPKLKDSCQVFTPEQRELIFDIDISDYDDVRFCCQGKGICNKCWPLMGIAAQSIDHFVQNVFDYHNILWVYSGRRGIHCWVADPAARALTDEARSALAHYMGVYEGGSDTRARLNIEYQLQRGRQLHPSLELVYSSFLEPGFHTMYLSDDSENANSLANDKVATKVFQTIADFISGAAPLNKPNAKEDPKPRLLENIKKTLEASGPRAKTPAEKWASIVKLCTTHYFWVPKAVIFCMTYPRLDVEVSTKRNHLLKAPFVIHPGTGNICVPIAFADIGSFTPDSCPTMSQAISNWEKGLPPLPSAVTKIFQQFLAGLRAHQSSLPKSAAGFAATAAAAPASDLGYGV
eukprot:NODE_1150_length_1550_cov_14.940706_g953_i0.p1 GENE.NODE_1150_length_1550_cov_14.940706_g953_i0~~NODE_1150_length_1550_cov_14.940706_g953_i0.p1  ORF type:complete len:427 (+),score=82.99 NODE_1150_length_1550_cov_14.940706_g953_i0:98-1378(+)